MIMILAFIHELLVWNMLPEQSSRKNEYEDSF